MRRSHHMSDAAMCVRRSMISSASQVSSSTQPKLTLDFGGRYIIMRASLLTNSLHVILFLQIGIDLIGPIPRTPSGNQHSFTVIDYFRKWAEAFPLPNKTVLGVAQCLFTTICQYVWT